MDTRIIRTLKGYELRDRIGAGGFGAVYRAYQSTVGREVAIKIILPGLANQPEFIRRFEGEAQIVARLEHPHITPLYDYWRDPDGAYLVMRWLKGGSLRDALQHGAFDVRTASLFLDQVASALSLAHRNHVIHRDIKPGNILLDEDGNAYLTDFGIAKDLNLPGENTQPDAIVGSLDYISPEQARSEPITARTDVYSLGVTLYEVISGEHPFKDLSPIERLYKHINDSLPDITTLDAAVTAQVNRVIQKATAKNPDHRYADALAFAADFREAIGIKRSPANDVELLTQREQEILQLVIDGLSNKEIAQRLTVTLSTVKWHVNQIYTKLGVRSRVQAMVRARELNLLTKSSEAPLVTQTPTEDFYPKNPYKGLRAFQAADNQDFFGRETVTAKLVKRLEEAHEFKRFLAVIGPSGSGKSSLVKAGLIPALWRGDLPGSEKWFIVELLPGAHPLDELEIALTRVAANHAGGLHEQLLRDRRGLIRAAQLILPGDGSELVLVIDQFEEVFTLLEDEATRMQFLDLLYSAVTEARSRVRVILTLRADFYDRPLHYPEFGELVRSRLETIMPLSAAELERAIAGPAQRVDVTFEAGLTAGIIADVNYQPGALPLLQYALTELFEQRKGHVLTREAYQSIGGTVGALANRAEEVYLSLDDQEQEVIRQLFLRLVTPGEGTEDTRRRVARSELLAIAPDADVMDEIIDTFASYRLFSLDTDASTRAPTVEVAHEALLRVWERLRQWLTESRDEIKLQRQLGMMAAEWQSSHQDSSFLALGSRLNQFEVWAKETRLTLTGAEHAYLNASIARRVLEEQAEVERKAREKGLEQRSTTFLRGLVAVLVLSTLGALVLSGVALNQSRIAEQHAVRADHNAAEAQNVALINGSQAALANGNTDQAIALALEAVTLDPVSARAQVALSEAAYAPGTIRIFEGHTNSVSWVEFSPDGLKALSSSYDGTLILWDIQTGAAIRRFEGNTEQSGTVDFMPDGLTAISGSYDTTMIQWNLQTGEVIRRFEGQPDPIWSVAISADGLFAASGGSVNNLVLWDIQTGEIIRRFEGHTFGIGSVEFSADGRQLLTASADGSVILWDVATGQILHRLEGHTSWVSSAVFSPDNSVIASVSDDSWVILWDRETGEMIKHFSERAGNGTTILDVAFSPDGRALLAGGVAGMVLWDIETSQPLIHLRGHQGDVKSVAFNPNGRTVISAAADGTLRLWDLEDGQIIRHYPSVGSGMRAFAVSSDGQTVLSPSIGDSRTNVSLWELSTGAEISHYSLIEFIGAAALSPDGQTALLGTDHHNGTPSDIIELDVKTGTEIRRLTGHPAGVRRIGFFPDGHTAFSNDWKGITILWDVTTGKEIRRFSSEEPGRLTDWFTPDGQALIDIYASGTMVLWDVVTGAEVRRFEGHTLAAMNIDFSGDGQRAFSGGQDNTTILWDVDTGSILHRFTDHSAQIAIVDMTEDGSLGIAGAADNTTLLWDLNTGKLIRRYSGGVFQPVFLPGNRTALSNNFGNMELWRIDATLDDLLTWTRANRHIPDLSCEQRLLYRLEPLCETESIPFPAGSE